MNITIATFNCENLFNRFKFSEKATEAKITAAVQNGFIIDKKLFKTLIAPEKELTAKAILATNADIIALQEVENLDTLKSFNSKYLKGNYPYSLVIDGNDPRLIDVAVLSKYPFELIKTHQFLKKGSNKIFSRDCLQVQFSINGQALTLFINHFKSMLDKTAKDEIESRKNTAPKRKLQAKTVLDIISQTFGATPEQHLWAVLGDFNDYPDKICSVNELINSPWLENIVKTKLPAEEQWTHFWDTTKAKAKLPEYYKQIDYLLPSLALANKLVGNPTIYREGITTNAVLYTGKRMKEVSAKIAASDHCPVVATFNI